MLLQKSLLSMSEIDKVIYTKGLPDIDVRFLISRILRILTRLLPPRGSAHDSKQAQGRRAAANSLIKMEYGRLVQISNLAIVERAIAAAVAERDAMIDAGEELKDEIKWRRDLIARDNEAYHTLMFPPARGGEQAWRPITIRYLDTDDDKWVEVHTNMPTRRPMLIADRLYSFLGSFAQVDWGPEGPIVERIGFGPIEDRELTEDEWETVYKFLMYDKAWHAKTETATQKLFQDVQRAIDMWEAILSILRRLREMMLPTTEVVDFTPPEDIQLLRGMARTGYEKATAEAKRRANAYWDSVVA